MTNVTSHETSQTITIADASSVLSEAIEVQVVESGDNNVILIESSATNTITTEVNHVVAAVENAVSVLTVGTQGPPGADGAAGYNHTQSSAASTWTINHNLGYKPSVELFNSGGVEIEGEITHTSVNQVVVNFVSAITGGARLI